MNSTTDRAQGVFQLIRDNAGEDLFGDGANGAEIARYEKELGIAFTDSYQAFLREFGWSVWPDYVLGVADGMPDVDVLVWTRDERQRTEGVPALPFHLLPFNPDGWGNLYCLDTSKLREGTAPVVFWNHESEQAAIPDVTHPDFLDWLEEAVAQEKAFEAEERLTGPENN